MMLVLGYCGRDTDQAARLMRWIQFLSSKHDGAMRQWRILLVAAPAAAKRARHTEIVDIATQTFGKVYVHIPSDVSEQGWPQSCNEMFRAALLHVEEHFRKCVFWLEPDAVPIAPDWAEKIGGEWEQNGAPDRFMGAYVTKGGPHMSGIGIYGRDWRKVAPKLIEATDVPWDMFAAGQVVTRLHETVKIQQLWPSHFFSAGARDLFPVNPQTLLFHQSKDGSLIRLIDRQYFNGECFQGHEDIIQPSHKVMRQYFSCDNATKKIRLSGLEFIFVKVDNVGGAWRGVYATENEEEVAALLTGGSSIGVRPIAAEEYDRLAKKKAMTSNLFTTSNTKPPLEPPLAKSAGVVVEVPPARPADSIPASPEVVPENWEDVVEMGKVAPPNTLVSEKPKVARAKRKRKASEPGGDEV